MEINSKDSITMQIKVSLANIIWTHKIQEKSADILISRYRIIQVLTWCLSALTSGTLIIILFNNSSVSSIIGAILGTLSIIFQSYINFAKLPERVNDHKNIAVDYWNLRESYKSLLVDVNNLSIKTISEKRDYLQDEARKVHEKAPRSIKKAYKIAEKAFGAKNEGNYNPQALKKIIPDYLDK